LAALFCQLGVRKADKAAVGILLFDVGFPHRTPSVNVRIAITSGVHYCMVGESSVFRLAKPRPFLRAVDVK
jgi:hypothetical protein